MAPTVDELLAAEVASGGERRRFGELSLAEVEQRVEELSAATGFGHRSRVGAVAAAWRTLAARMRATGAATVGELDRAELERLPETLWVLPPGGSLLP